MVEPGTPCFVKVKGYRLWPARVNILPNDVTIPSGKIPVFFYGTHHVSYVSHYNIFEYSKYKDIYGLCNGSNDEFSDGMMELEMNPSIFQLGKDVNAINFLLQYYKFDEIEAEKEYSRKLKVNSDASQFRKNLMSTSQFENVKRKPTFTPTLKSSPKLIEIRRPKRASALKFEENLKSYVQEINYQSTNDDTYKNVLISKKSKIHKPQKQLSVKPIAKNKERFPIEQRSLPLNQNINSLDINQEEKNMKITSQLSIIDREIKRNLVVGQENYETCMKLFVKLVEMSDITLTSLCKVPEIITTMKKCRRYTKDQSIKETAFKIYFQFYQVYDHSDLDEKIEAGTELLKRNPGTCKSAQILLDELFLTDSKRSLPNVTEPLVNSVPSLNTRSSFPDSQSLLNFDHVLEDINELLNDGSLQLIEWYDVEEGIVCPYGDRDTVTSNFSSNRGLYHGTTIVDESVG